MQSNILIDWITFSSKIHDVHSMTELLGMTDVEWKKCSGRYYYGEGWRFGNITIYSEGLSADMGVCVEMSGQGCRDFETFGTGDWHSIFKKIFLNKMYMNISRLDVAYDDFDKALDIEAILSDTLLGNYVSRNKHWNIQKGSRGATVEHGDRGGNMYIRIYDKKAERKRDDLEYWVRCELQMRGDLPINFVEALLSGDDPIEMLYFKVLNNYLRYVETNSSDSNKRRWKTADHWSRFLKTAEKQSIFIAPGVDYNMLGLRHYVFDTAGNAIKTYIDIEGMDKFLEYLGQVQKSKNPKYDYLRQNASMDGANL